MAHSEKIKLLIRSRVRAELQIAILDVIMKFESKEEPDYGDLTEDDKIHALSSIITRKTEF